MQPRFLGELIRCNRRSSANLVRLVLGESFLRCCCLYRAASLIECYSPRLNHSSREKCFRIPRGEFTRGAECDSSEFGDQDIRYMLPIAVRSFVSFTINLTEVSCESVSYPRDLRYLFSHAY